MPCDGPDRRDCIRRFEVRPADVAADERMFAGEIQ
jgi:hypothetical protein